MSAAIDASRGRSTARRWATVLGPVAALVVGVAACSSSGHSATASSPSGAAATTASSQSAGSPAATTDTVVVKNFTFTPMDLTVAAGTTVTWKFEDSAQHTVKASDNSFTSAALNDGKTFQHTFANAGTYSYICSIHQYMTGTITVK